MRLNLKQRVQLGQTVRRIRGRHKLTQTQFGLRFGVSQSIVSEWEAGTRFPNEVALLEIAKLGNLKEAAVLGNVESVRRGRSRVNSGIAIAPHNTNIPQNPEYEHV